MKPHEEQFKMAFSRMPAEEKWNWHTCLHEAGHTVVHIRNGGVVNSVEVQGAFIKTDHPAGITHLHPHYCSNAILVAVAGHFAEKKWGNRPVECAWKNDGTTHDFQDMCRFGEDFARKMWRRGIRKLHYLAKQDPSFEQQVKAVAKALSLQEKLTGDEVVAIMAVQS